MQSVFVFVWWSSNIHVEFLEKDDGVSHSKLKKQGFVHLGRVDRDVCGGNIFFVSFLVYVNLGCEITDFVAMFGSYAKNPVATNFNLCVTHENWLFCLFFVLYGFVWCSSHVWRKMMMMMMFLIFLCYCGVNMVQAPIYVKTKK